MALKLADIKDDEALKAAVSAAVDEATKALKDKNAELGRDAKKTKEQLAIFDGITKEDLEAMREAVDAKKEADKKALEDKGEYDKLLEQMRADHKKALKEAKDAKEKATGELHAQLRKGQLTASLAKEGVPELLGAATKLLEDQVAIVEQDGVMVARVGDKTVEDFVKGWFDPDDGKHFKRASNGSGGGSGGSNQGGSGGNDPNPEELFDPSHKNYNLTKAAGFMRASSENHTLGQTLLSKYHGAEATEQ